jgi:RNA polymerase sigma factor for flagellar operon FliA
MQTAELEQLWTQHHASRDPGLRERLILQYAPLVKYVVGRMAVSLPGLLSNEDILSYGTIGLIQAVDRYDPSVGVKFETYAIRRIRGSILDTIRSLHQLSRDVNRRAREVEQAYDELIHRLGRMPENKEVADHLGLSLDEFHTVLAEASTTVVSLNSSPGDGEDGERPSLIDQITDDDQPDVSSQVERRQLHRALVRAIEQLSDRDRLVINLYYYEELTLKEISEVLGVSTSRVSQLHSAAIFKLRGALRAAMSSAGTAERSYAEVA